MWVKVFLALLSLANTIAKKLQQGELIDAGAKAEAAKQLAATAARLKIGKRVTDEIATLTAGEVTTGLEEFEQP